MSSSKTSSTDAAEDIWGAEESAQLDAQIAEWDEGQLRYRTNMLKDNITVRARDSLWWGGRVGAATGERGLTV